MRRPVMLDLFCGAGGMAAGYHRAGWDVIGVDHVEQPRYPFAFHRMDWREGLERFGVLADAVHASPPCQAYCGVNVSGRKAGRQYPDLIAPVREALVALGKPYVIENVPGAPLRFAVRLCGSAFGLKVRRHRCFESSVLLFGTECVHGWQEREGNYPTCYRPRPGTRPTSSVVQVYGNTPGKALWPEAMGISWMTSRELAQSIPPAYALHLGRQLLAALESR